MNNAPGDTRAVRIVQARHAGATSLRLRWANGQTLTVDLSEPVRRLKGLRRLRDPAIFAQVSKGEGGHSVVWPGNLDMGADRLWEMTLEQNGYAENLPQTAIIPTCTATRAGAILNACKPPLRSTKR